MKYKYTSKYISKLLESIRSERESLSIRLYRKTSSITTVDEEQEFARIENDFIKRFPKAEDKKNEFVPYIIAPTENGWQEPIFNNRKLKSGKANVRITSKNATPIEYEVTIPTETPHDGKIIEVNGRVEIIKTVSWFRRNFKLVI